jgi:chondroitin 4-sulfotransferase 11
MFGIVRSFFYRIGFGRFFKPLYVSIFPILIRDKLAREFVNPYSSIENEYKVVFVHIPKNAGNGFTKSVFGQATKGHNYLQHYKVNDIEKYRKYFKFTLLRDVHPRFYSAYSYLKKGGFGIYDREFFNGFIDGLDFSDFIKKMYFDKTYQLKIMSWTHFIPQSTFFYVDGRNEFDYVGRVENISNAINHIGEKLGISSLSNVVDNASSTPNNWEMHYDKETLGMVSEMYSDDIKLIEVYRDK